MPTTRPVRPDELDDLLALYEMLFPEESAARTEAVDDAWDAIQADPNTTVLGTVTDRLVATCQLTIIPAVARGGQPFAVIEYVVTHDEERGEGYGSQCLEHAIDRAADQGCEKVLLQTSREDERVHAFYEQCGFDRDAKTGYVYHLEERTAPIEA
ncbi:GNAT family N-acetyltransferase [Halococcoides cellulosivorans]|uniref:GNAT family N-acetyltransferase n=1 Tax=Halococcoides cellulosivorans TaxID=1679096 RepID=A0A2R4X314_9EURY|nr:GNAT family N-acetyltransferase [Halococcoides cellulosivorans]AWB28185.1 GNAT family N-acetyltransferase [Halococcoides cellulosivorans]